MMGFPLMLWSLMPRSLMPRSLMSRWRITAWIAAAACLAGGWLAGAPGAGASSTQQSIFQDDSLLVYRSPRAVSRTLSRLASLGVQRVRVTLKWADVAPDAFSRRRPPNFASRTFTAADPASYPATGWAPYDQLVKLAARNNIAVQFNLTAPGPLWAMGRGAPDAKTANHWKPSAADFYLFARAVGARYSGSYHGLPRVSFWSIWNEPNQPGWLAPQWQRLRGRNTLVSAALYRQLALVGYKALSLTGHSTRTDTILIGEIAPKGSSAKTAVSASAPLPFLRALYCVDTRFRPLRGGAATGLGCPSTGSNSRSRRSFVAAQPALFAPSGFAHHPYFFTEPPSVRSPNPEFAPLADLDRLESWLDRSLRTYGVSRRLAIYLTEYGYQTNPPDPYVHISLTQQSEYLNEADYLAFRDPRVRSMAQFLLQDDRGNPLYPRGSYKYWATFQTGLQFADGSAKPALAAYRIPIWLPHPAVRRGHSLLLWGQLRPASRLGAQRAAVQWRSGARGSWRMLATVATSPLGFLQVVVRPPGSGLLRILWRPARGAALSSRSASVSVR